MDKILGENSKGIDYFYCLGSTRTSAIQQMESEKDGIGKLIGIMHKDVIVNVMLLRQCRNT